MGAAAAVSGGEVWVLGGSTLAFNGGETVTLDTASNSSCRLNLAHELVASATAAARSDGRGGGRGRGGVWRAGPILLTPRCCCAAASINGVLYVASGPGLDAPRGMPLASAGRLDPALAARGWRAVAPLGKPLAHAILVETGGLLYAGAGTWRGSASSTRPWCSFERKKINIAVYGAYHTKWELLEGIKKKIHPI